ncbi:MAG: pitrilysin family protein [Patescibacteria group bacterium]
MIPMPSIDPYLFEKIEVDGVPVHVKNWPNNVGCCIRIIFHVGARHDPKGKAGLAHLFEHLPFNGCADYHDHQTISRVNDDLFYGSLNAHTGFEQTCFHGWIPDLSRATEAITFLSSLVNRPLLDKDQFAREIGVIEQEIWKDFANGADVEFCKRVRRLLYGDHPFSEQARPYGWPDTINQITIGDCLDHHNQYYHRGNCEIVLVGNITSEMARQFLPPLTGVMSEGLGRAWPRIYECPGPLEKEVVISRARDLGLANTRNAQIRISRLCSVVDWSDATVWVAGSIIRERLFEIIRQEIGATYSPSFNHQKYSDHQFVTGLIVVDPSSVTRSRQAVRDSIDWLAEDSSEVEKLFKDKRARRIGELKAAERTAAQIARSAEEEIVTTGTKTLFREIEELEQLGREEVVRFAATELSEERLFWVIVEP